MSNNITFRFGAAAVLITVGCLLLLTPFTNVGIFFMLATFFTMPRSELKKPLGRRDFFETAAALAGFIALLVCCKLFIPKSVTAAAQHFVSSPLFILPFWSLYLFGLHRLYKYQKKNGNGEVVSTM